MVNQTSSHGTHNKLGICSKTKSRDDESSVFFHAIHMYSKCLNKINYNYRNGIAKLTEKRNVLCS